ncbi:MAG TPA: TRAP transporter large permease subunit [Gammaproteobacteria bacterium]|nr:TRAP transporter large permease subunit [Gammaproteobacteria bacterium]HIL18453.1 TRAP transporter large permease subunit [Gammaproteobacteria bacterium]
MGIETISLIIIAAMLFLMACGVPLVYTTLSIAIACTMYHFYGVTGDAFMGLPLVASRVGGFVTEYVFVAVPLFVMMASILEKSGVAKDLYDAMFLISGRLRGGVAVQTTLVAVVMAAMTGIIGGEIVLLGLLALPQMIRLGYDKKLAMGTICAGGSLGTLIPPSVVLIVYGLVANVSISKLFLAGAIPGLMLATLYITYIIIRCWLQPSLAPSAAGYADTIERSEKIRLIKGLILPIGVIVWVLGSIYGGIASVTEAAAVGVVGAIASAIVRKEFSFAMLRDALFQTMRTVGMLIWLSFGANALVGIYNIMGGTAYMQELFTTLPVAPIFVILMMMGLLIVMGTFMDWIGICLLTMPIFVPTIIALGYDPVWFGILFTMNMQVSYLSPPFGPACFYLKTVAPPEITLNQIFMSMWPFIGLQLIGLAVVLFYPETALWLTQFI